MNAPEPKTTCRHCGATILVMTAERTRGYCMPHRHYGFTFAERAGCRVKPGQLVTMDHARREFLRTYALREFITDGDSRERWTAFESVFQPGDEMRAFAGHPASKFYEFHASRGFVIVRAGEIVDGVVTETKMNPEDRRGFAQLAGVDEIEVEREFRDGRTPDYWGTPIPNPRES